MNRRAAEEYVSLGNSVSFETRFCGVTYDDRHAQPHNVGINLWRRQGIVLSALSLMSGKGDWLGEMPGKAQLPLCEKPKSALI